MSKIPVENLGFCQAHCNFNWNKHHLCLCTRLCIPILCQTKKNCNRPSSFRKKKFLKCTTSRILIRSLFQTPYLWGPAVKSLCKNGNVESVWFWNFLPWSLCWAADQGKRPTS
jgi:hypothetical protein